MPNNPSSWVVLYLIIGVVFILMYRRMFVSKGVILAITQIIFVLFWLPLILIAFVMRVRSLFRSR